MFHFVQHAYTDKKDYRSLTNIEFLKLTYLICHYSEFNIYFQYTIKSYGKNKT